MKPSSVIAALLLVVSACLAQQSFEVSFRYDDPKANNVGLACECNNWSVLFLSRDSRGRWTKTLSLSPGVYAYRFLVNGKNWELDPGNPDRKTINGKEYSVITVGSKDEPAESPTPEREATGPPGTTFTYTNANAQTVLLAGEFNQWSASATPMLKNLASVWSVTLMLEPGRYQYKLIVDGQWTQDPQGAEFAPDGFGAFNSVAIVSKPGEPAAKRLARSSQMQFLPGGILVFDAPLSATAWSEAARLPKPEGDDILARNARPKTVKVGVAVPEGFDPKKSWPLLIVSSTADWPSIEHLNHYYQPATACGWVALAADGPDKAKDDSNAWRWTLVASALDALAVQWPGSTNWPVACAGFSGGAKRSGLLGALMMKQGYHVIGMWMGGCDQDMASLGLSLYSPSHSRFTSVPIFLSSGERDTVAPPGAVKEVVQSMRGKGFKRVRVGSYDGGHDPSAEQIRMGLEWFIEQSKR